MAPSAHPLPLRTGLALLAFLCSFHVVSGATYPAFTLVTANHPFTPRDDPFAFEWYGRAWIAGGDSDTGPGSGFLDDVWSSYDMGRNWTLSSHLPSTCYAVQVSPIVYNQALYLTCGVNDPNNVHTTTFVSSDPQLLTSSWTALSGGGTAGDDGLHGRASFNAHRMAVPFDGVGTLILVNGRGTPNVVFNDVWWLSATDKFQPGSLNPGTEWHQFTVPGTTTAYQAPWPARYLASTTVDAAGLTMIVAGGQTYANSASTFFGDVWQLSWLNGQTVPAVYQLTGSASWSPRSATTMWAVHDALFLYGGYTATDNGLDELYQSMDYGATWYLVTSTATGVSRSYASPLVIGRRFFIVGGYTMPGTALNDVRVAYW